MGWWRLLEIQQKISQPYRIFPSWVGDVFCDGSGYNTVECGWDGEDC